MKSESENTVENIRGKTNFKNAERENSFEVEKVGRKSSVNWNHTNSIIYWKHKYSKSIHVDLNHTDLNQLNPANSINIRSIHDSDNI